jgi:hypothetical protein
LTKTNLNKLPKNKQIKFDSIVKQRLSAGFFKRIDTYNQRRSKLGLFLALPDSSESSDGLRWFV